MTTTVESKLLTAVAVTMGVMMIMCSVAIGAKNWALVSIIGLSPFVLVPIVYLVLTAIERAILSKVDTED